MDSLMPNMNGLEAAKEIRGLGYTNPIIGVTGNALEEDKISFLNAGATTVLIKPVNITVLHELFHSKLLYFYLCHCHFYLSFLF